MEPPAYGSALGLDYESIRKTPLEHIAPFVGEFLGTWLVVFTAGLISILGDPIWNATALAAILTVCVYVFGPVTGGHFNPAVSFASALVGKESWSKMVVYVTVQVLAALLAGAAYSTAFGQSTVIGPSEAYAGTSYPGFVEAFYTAVMCFVALNVVYSRRNNPRDDQNHFFALAVGFVYVAGGHAAGNISGACFNPAIAFGMDVPSYFSNVSALSSSGSWAFAYTAFQLMGAVAAALLFRLCRPEELHYEVDPYYEPSLVVKMLSEFLGTSVLVLTVGLNVVGKSTCTPWSAAAALMCMIYALGNVSGAHFNPSVTLAVMLSGRGKCPPLRALAFAVAQSLAALLMACVIAGVHSHGPSASESFCLRPLTRTTSAGSENYWEPVFWSEFLFTFLLAFTVLSVATTTLTTSFTRQNFPFGLAIAACVTAGGFVGGSLNGGVMNPAVALGISSSCSMEPGNVQAPPSLYFWLFTLFEECGGLLAAFVFVLTHRHEYYAKQEQIA